MPEPRDESAEAARRVTAIYNATQTLHVDERAVSIGDLEPLADRWKDEGTPSLQRQVAEVQLENLRNGLVDPVFAALGKALANIPLTSFSLLDAACATGYYSEIIRHLDSREIAYTGCDYSPAMIETARTHYPNLSFSVQDITALGQPDRSYDVVLASGVLEHVPDFGKAIAQVCRVADAYVIVHRCPITSEPTHRHTIGSQYNIETPRTWFAKRPFLALFNEAGFDLAKAIPVHLPDIPSPRSDPLAWIRSRFNERRGGKRRSTTEVITFVFKRSRRPAPAPKV